MAKIGEISQDNEEDSQCEKVSRRRKSQCPAWNLNKTGDKTSSKRFKSHPILQWRIPGGKGRILKDFFTIEHSIICKNLEEVINNIGILVQQNLLAICFPNCV